MHCIYTGKTDKNTCMQNLGGLVGQTFAPSAVQSRVRSGQTLRGVREILIL